VVSVYGCCISTKLTTTPRNECEARITGVHNPIHQKAESWVDAIAIFTLAYDDGTVEAVPVADGEYDTPHFMIPSPNGRPGRAQFNLPQPRLRNTDIPQPHQLHPPRKLGTHIYAVLRGEEVGIFGSWYISCFLLSRVSLAYINHC